MQQVWNRVAMLTFVAGVAILAAPRRAPAQSTDQVGQWGPVLNWGRQAKHAVLLPTGNALIWSTGDNAFVWNTATTGTFTPVPFLVSDLHCAGQATLADGKVIVIGGVNVTPHIGTAITAIFDPFTGTWTRGKDMNFARWYGTATILADGRLLASNGDDQNQQRVLIPEVYDPAANTWTKLTTASRDQALYSFMFQMPDGRVYEAGSKASTAYLNLSGTGSWTDGPTNSFGSSGYAESCAMYGTGKILRSGGGDPAWANAAVIDTTVASPAWKDIASMAFPRRRHNLVILADGQVMAVGGTRQGDDETKAILAGEIWNPDSLKWTTVAAMKEARMYHSTGLLLADGRVLAGGGEAGGRLHAEIYSPPYLFKGARPTIASAPATAAYGSTFTVNSPQAADNNQRYVPLTFTRSGSNLLVSAPASGRIAPPGYHLLVIKNTAGVPSVAAWLRLGAGTALVPGNVTGVVTNAASGAAISGATVSCTAASGTTASNGSYTLSNLSPGEYLVTAARTGFAPLAKTVTVQPGATARLDFALVAPGTLAGRVTDAATGNPIAGATVTYKGGSVTTNSTGNYTATVSSGSQTVSASATGYESLSKSATVSAGGSVTVNFALQPRETSIQGEVTDAETSETIAGATVTYSGGSTASDSFGFYRLEGPSPGVYRVTASAPGYLTASGDASVEAGFVTTLDFDLRPTHGTQTITVAPVADAYVSFFKRQRDKNFGRDSRLQVRQGRYASYLKFTVTGLSGPAQSARLRLFNTEGSTDGGRLYLVSSSWKESSIKGRDAPRTSGAPLATAGAVSAGNWVELDVTKAIVGDGTYSFALYSQSDDSATYSSREGASPPALVLGGVTGGGTLPPVADFSATPRNGETPLSVQFTDLSEGEPTAWQWIFGDGGTSTAQNPTHLYRGPGSYSVTLTVTNGGGSDFVTRQSFITVNDPRGPVEHHASVSGGSVASMMVETDTHVGVMMGAYLAAITTKPQVDITEVSGLGLTWRKVRSQCSGRGTTGIAVFVGEGEPVISEHVMATFADAPDSAVITVSVYTGANPENPIGNVISGNTVGASGACSGGVDNFGYSFSLPVSAPGAAIFTAAAIRSAGHTAGPGYTERMEVHAGNPGGIAGLAIGERVFDQPATAAEASGALSKDTDWAAVAVEIVP